MTLPVLQQLRKASAQSCVLPVPNRGSTCLRDGKMSQRNAGMSLCSSGNASLTIYRYLHALFLALDANFRLKRKRVSSDEADPGLSKGWAYVVEESKYKAHLALHFEEVEPVSILLPCLHGY